MLIQCGKCGHVGEQTTFDFGRGKAFGQHESHRYCPACHVSITWFGWRYGQEPRGLRKQGSQAVATSPAA